MLETTQIARASSAEIQATMSGFTTWTFWGSGTEVRMTELDVYTEFKENIVRKHDGRFGVNIPWIPGAKLDGTNEEQS